MPETIVNTSPLQYLHQIACLDWLAQIMVDHVASITVQQIGITGTATPQQVRRRWREVRSA